MKKVLSLLFIMTFIISGCNSNKETQQTEDTNPALNWKRGEEYVSPNTVETEQATEDTSVIISGVSINQKKQDFYISTIGNLNMINEIINHSEITDKDIEDIESYANFLIKTLEDNGSFLDTIPDYKRILRQSDMSFLGIATTIKENNRTIGISEKQMIDNYNKVIITDIAENTLNPEDRETFVENTLKIIDRGMTE